MRLVPPYQKPEPQEPPVVKAAEGAQMKWERNLLLGENHKLAKAAWRLIKTRGTSSPEYQEIFIQNQKILARLQEIKTALKIFEKQRGLKP
jgi:hypothetical protein